MEPVRPDLGVPTSQAAAPPEEPLVATARATAHRHPFAPMRLAGEPTKENVFRRSYDGGGHCAQNTNTTARAFIGPTNTEWMQQHQRWWARTAEKMESSGGTTKKLRRGHSKPEAPRDSPSQIFSAGHRRGSRKSVGSMAAVASSDMSDSQDSGAEGSDWSSLGDVADRNPGQTQEINSENTGATAPAKPVPTTTVASGSEPGYNTIPMPMLSSPPDDPPLRSAPLHGSGIPEDQHKARRRSSLNTLKGLFRRHSTNRPKLRRRSDAAVSVGRRSLDTVLGAPSGDRGRSASTSTMPGLGIYPKGHGAPESPRGHGVEPGAASPRLSSLRRIAVTRNTRGNSLQLPADLEAMGDVPVEIPLDAAGPLAGADITLHLSKVAGRADVPVARLSARFGKSRRAMVAKVKAYYNHHAQLSETTVILSTRAVVRRETVSHDALSEPYNEFTCRRYRESAEEWAEMWLALTKRGILFYLTSKKRPAVSVLFPPYSSIAPRVSLFSTLDLSLAIMYYGRSAAAATVASAKGKKAAGGAVGEDPEANKPRLHMAIVKFPSAQVACEWYREIGQALLLGRVMYPSRFLSGSIFAASPTPSTVIVNVPEMGIKVQVKLGRHAAEVPSGVLTGGQDDALLERQWRCETTTVWHIRRDVVNALLSDKVVGAKMQEWLDAERNGEMAIGMAWRRYDRLDWVMPCGALDAKGNFQVASVNDKVVGPQLLEGTHALEMRILEHYPDRVTVDGCNVYEPIGVEGFAMLKRDKKHKTEISTYRPALLTTHNGLLFFIHAPRAARHLDVCANQCNSPAVSPGQEDGPCSTHADQQSSRSHLFGRSSTQKAREPGGPDNEQVVRLYHPDARNCSRQMSLAKYMLNITDVTQIVPLLGDSDEATLADGSSDYARSSLSNDANATLLGSAGQRGSHRERAKGKLLSFLRSKKNRESACKFKLVTSAGSSVVLWTAGEQCMREWVRRLTELRFYWANRMAADCSLHSQMCMLNYSVQGRGLRYRDVLDWSDEGAWAERGVWHACMLLGCRNIIKAGILYRKRHRHKGMHKVFCVLTQGRLIEFKYPKAPLPPRQTSLAERMIRNDVNMSRLFKDAVDTDGQAAGDGGSIAPDADPTTKTASGSDAHLLFTRSRSLSLQRCYVVSRFTDDLSTHDIMCEPWVMTDIGNYTGLRLADRVYADGIISHELITDCIFTVWRPKFVPVILRATKGSEIRHTLDDLSDASEVSVDERGLGDAARSTSSSPSPESIRLAEASRSSGDAPRASGEEYASSVSNASSVSSVRRDGSSKPGAYRVGNEIRLSVDDRHDGANKVSAMGMGSSMRRRVGVYKARTNSEMAQWVVAINQEIRRMVLTSEW